jgi:5S rRNA maturation endonuclease (ribonuclease M5)
MVRRLADASEFLAIFTEKVNKEQDSVILVEGSKDKDVLKQLGVKLPIIEISHAKLDVLIEQLDMLGIRKLVVLTDLDSKGQQLLRKIKQLASIYGLLVDESYRENLKKLRIEEVEDLSKFLNH